MPRVPQKTRSASPWTFQNRFRRAGFGWRASGLASQRIGEALAEIRTVARRDPELAAEGAVRFLERLSPALEGVDSSSGALGNAAYAAVQELIPIIAEAKVDRGVRERWLERLFEAYQNDDPPYIESLGESWGSLCASPELASRWADELLSLTQHVQAERRQGRHDFFKGAVVCHSALFAAGRHAELVALIEGDPRPMWRDLLWIGRVKVASGAVDEAIAFMASRIDDWTPMAAPARFAEQALLNAGRRAEAYENYALEANVRTSYLATYRAIAKKYPEIEPDRLLADLIATTPAEEGKWFATAKTLKRFEWAMKLAWRSPCDPRTLTRAARDQLTANPVFSGEVALAALHWICEGHGYELIALDVLAPYQMAQQAARTLGQSDKVEIRMRTMLARGGSRIEWVREVLRLPGETKPARSSERDGWS